MPLTPANLGRISVTACYITDRRQLVDRIVSLVDDLPPGDEALGRIVVILPDTLRRLLGWPEGATPVPMLVEDCLVFRRPESAIVIPKLKLS